MDQTSGDLAQRDQREAWRRLTLAVMLLLPLVVPLGWLALELRTARDRAAEAIAAGATTVGRTLGDLLHRFEAATAGLQLPEGQNDGTALTARLLRLEARLPPSSGLLVFDRRGRFVSGSHPPADGADASGAVWFHVALQAPSRAPIVFAPGPTPLGPAEGVVIARRIDHPHGGAAGVVVTVLPADALRRAAQPEWLAAYGTIHLSDAGSGHELLRLVGTASGGPVGWASPLVASFLAGLPALAIAQPVTGGVDITPGGLRWEAQLDPRAVLAAGADGLLQRGGWACGIALALVGVILLAGARVAAPVRARRPGPDRPIPEDAPGPARHHDDVAKQERQRAEAALADAEARLRALAHERDLVLAAVDHSLRSPIGGILNAAVLLLDDDLDDTQRPWVLRLRTSCEVLLAKLDGLLGACGAQADSAEPDTEEVDIAGLVREVCDVLEPQAHDKGLALRVVVEEAIMGVWRTDQWRVRQVLFNLIENAVTHTAHGAVEVRVSAVSTPEGGNGVVLQVADTGPGIEPAEQARIFDRFLTGCETAGGGRAGTGLGLSVCHSMATRIGGSLRLVRSAGTGSVFAFEFPAARSAAGECHRAPFAGRTALVIGLTEGIRQRVTLQLQGLGFAVEGTADGFVGLGLAERLATTRGALDLVLVDGALPGLPAEAFLLRLRSSRLLEGARIVWVASERTPIPDGASADAVIHHPPEPRDIERVALELLGSASALQAVDPEAPTPIGGRILLVSDDRVNRALLAKVLARAGFPVFTASSEDEAIRAARRARFDAVLIDSQMAGADGIAVTRRIRADEVGGARIPIIILADRTSGVLRRQHLNAGADAVLPKPAGPARLLAQLRQLVAANRAVLPRQESAEAVAADVSDLDIADEHLEILVLEAGPDRACECVRAFLADVTARVPRIEELLAASEWAAVRRSCDDLAGLAGTLGAVSLADALALLGDAARDGDALRAEHVMADITAISVRLRSRMPLRLEAVLARRGSSRQGRVA